MSALTSCPAVLAIELVPEGAPQALSLALESAHLLGEHIANDLARLLPGVLGNPDSVVDDSFAPGAMESLLEGPIYTKPPTWRGHAVPDVLLSGDHAKIAAWRRAEAQRLTKARRPDLWAARGPEKPPRKGPSDG